ncbi:MAG: sensor histidine kinase, partial [Candidatus Binatia bacterium]
VIVFAIDISEQKIAEENMQRFNRELQHLSQLKSQFASMVSHELRTPLTVIKEGINIVLDGIDGPVTPAQQDTLLLARNNVDRLARLINNVLNYEKLESGKMEMAFEEANLNDLVSEVMFFMELAARKKNIRIISELPPRTTKLICDADKLKEVLINLIDNSLKNTQAGGTISIRLKPCTHEIELEVEDNGVGIRPEDQKNIFEMFHQAGSPRASRLGGSGVGLAVCKLVVEQHHGRISVESFPGKGTKFSVMIPNRLSV